MKSPCLFLVILCTLLTCEAQRSNNDIIWYPVEDEDGVFISLYGEKRRDSPLSKWRSHRRARYSGMYQSPVQALPLSYDPTENQDYSFFYNINERRPGIALADFGENQKKKPHKKPPENNLQEILSEVFDYNKNPPTSSQRPWGNNQYPEWGTQTTGEWIQTGNQWGSNSQRPMTETSNNARPQSNQWGNSRPNGWLITTGSTNMPSRPEASDILVFPEDATRNTERPTRFTTMTPSNLIPTDPPTMSPCERLCPVTPEFNPVCGSDAMTYTNAGRLKCAQMCGRDVKLSHYGNCGRTTLVTPLVSNNQVKKLKQFWGPN